jgi:hypothetical protein
VQDSVVWEDYRRRFLPHGEITKKTDIAALSFLEGSLKNFGILARAKIIRTPHETDVLLAKQETE